jgi:hypothetical protein
MIKHKQITEIFMKKIIVISVLMLCGCATPPKPVSCDGGNKRPINTTRMVQSLRVDFSYSGNLKDALTELQTQHKELQLVFVDTQFANKSQVNINAVNTDLLGIIKEIGEQSPNADITYFQESKMIRVKFKDTAEAKHG